MRRLAESATKKITFGFASSELSYYLAHVCRSVQ